MRLVDLRGTTLSANAVNKAVPRAELDITLAVQQIQPLLDDVRDRGSDALVDVALKFDKVDPRPFFVTRDELDSAEQQLDPQLREAILESIERVRQVSAANLPVGQTVELASGAKVQQRWQPVESVGLYVPGEIGRAHV